jgi:hypothetical protein
VSCTGTGAVFIPSNLLATNTLYTATITTGASDAQGEPLASNSAWSFITVPAPTAPAVISTTPANLASGVATNQAVSATFSEAIAPATISGTTFTLTAPGNVAVAGTVAYAVAGSVTTFTLTGPGATVITGTYAYNATTFIATFTPSANLLADTTYSAADASGSAYTYMGGPRLSFRKYDRITPFAQSLFGGIHASQVTLSNCSGALCTPLAAEDAFAMTAGGGVDLRIYRHVAIRVVQAEYLMTRFGNPTTGIRESQNDIRLSSGLVFGFGGNPPPPEVEYTCSANPSTVFPGDPITVTGVALNLNPKRTASYTWTSDGGAISGTSNVASVDTKDAAPGAYTVKGHISEGMKPGQMADCSTTFTVKAFDPPTISCSASPTLVNFGDSSTITANAVSPQNRPLTYSYSATAGSISGTGASSTLATTGAAPEPITVTCNVADDKGHSASATTSVTVLAPPTPAPVAPLASSLCMVSFERDMKRPTRVDNEAKACLDDIALNLQRTTGARLALVGNQDANEQAAETKEAKLKHLAQKPSDAAERAINTRQYLVNEKGIDLSRILLYTGTDDAKTVTTTLIPVGAINPAAGNTPVD